MAAAAARPGIATVAEILGQHTALLRVPDPRGIRAAVPLLDGGLSDLLSYNRAVRSPVSDVFEAVREFNGEYHN